MARILTLLALLSTLLSACAADTPRNDAQGQRERAAQAQGELSRAVK